MAAAISPWDSRVARRRRRDDRIASMEGREHLPRTASATIAIRRQPIHPSQEAAPSVAAAARQVNGIMRGQAGPVYGGNKLFPLDRAGGLRTDVVDDAIHAAHADW